MPRPRPPRRPPLLIALQTEATIFMSQAIGQAGLAAAFLTGQKSLKHVHEINAYVMAAVVVIMVITAVAYRRSRGPVWVPWAAVVLLAQLALQITLGSLKIAGLHIFLGVIFVVSATLFTSYLFRVGSVSPRVLGPGEAEQAEAGDAEGHHRQQDRAER